ncbi:hypothetical protein HMPREF9709_01194 [Helcococcus kunzii ATCC 51366]|uniref:Major capsid protein n=1 Tax=Helcococcus kunzii ATCC 51366 TaxID=883114 RepID=H3NPD3_9FIRM|nr:hypothetical protein [Helcococcus kunzii]EHR33446.1 hypothetical protein HMPREF9709_01194 [Helcococcus kunzii ATCC 51366]
MAEENLQSKTDYLAAKDIDFAYRFEEKITGLEKMLSVMRVIPMPMGATVKTYKSSVTLAGGKVAEGEVIPLSKVKFEPDKTYELEWDKRRKSVPGEHIQRYGFKKAVSMTDDKLLNELNKNLRNNLFTNMKTGTGTATGVGLKGALAQGWAQLEIAYEDQEFVSVAFVNPLDVADYLGQAQVNMQKEFGMTYLENFLGYDVVFISNSVDKSTVITTVAENMVMYYVPVAGSDVANAFDLITGVKGFLGVKHFQDNISFTYQTLAVSSMLWLAEKLDGIFKVTITKAEL